MIPYKLHLLQHLKDTDKSALEDFCTQMQVMFQEDGFDDRLVFGDEATFHVTGKVNKHNTRILGTEYPHAIQDHVRDSSKMNVFCAISRKCVYEPFFFEGTTVNSEAYLAMLQNWLMELLLEGERADFIFQQNGAPPHWNLNVKQHQNATLHNKWIGRAGNNDCVLLHWLPRSPDLTPCDFFFWGYVNGLVYVPPLPTSKHPQTQLQSQKVRALLAARCCFEVTCSVDCSGFCEPHFAAKARVSPLGLPSVMNMLAPLVRLILAIAYGENEFMLLQMKGLVWGTGRALLRSPRGRNASRDGLVKLGWVHCLQYTLNCFQYNVCGLCRSEPSNHQLTLHNVI